MPDEHIERTEATGRSDATAKAGDGHVFTLAKARAARAAMSEAEKAVARAEVKAEIAAVDAYILEHGCPAEGLRRYLAEQDLAAHTNSDDAI